MACVLASGCGPSRPAFVPIPPELAQAEIAFVLNVTADGRSVVGTPSAIALDPSASAPLNLEWDEEQRLVLLVVDDERLGMHGLRRAQRPVSEYHLGTGAEPCERGALFEHEGVTRARIAATRSFGVFELPSGSNRFEVLHSSEVSAVTSLSLDFPVAASVCDGVERPEARPFDPDAVALLPADATVGGRPAYQNGLLALPFQIHGIETLDDTRLIAFGTTALFDFQRERAYQDLGSHRLLFSEVANLPPSDFDPPAGWQWREALRLPNTDASGERLLALTIDVAPTDVPSPRSALVIIELDQLGFVSARTSTVIAGEQRKMLVQSDASTLVIGETFTGAPGLGNGEAVRFFAAQPEGPFERSLLAGVSAPTSLAATGLPSAPHLAGFDDGLILAGDLARSPDALRTIRLEGGISQRGRVEHLRVGTRAENRSFWAGDHKGAFFRGSVEGQASERLHPKLPAEARACGGPPDACGWREAANDITALEFVDDESSLAATVLDCPHVVTFRLSDLCPTLVPVPASAPVAGALVRRTLQRRGDLLFISDESSEIYVFDAPRAN